MNIKTITTYEWHGLYNESWQGEIVPEAFSHPAKYSRGMIRQIYRHMIERGYITPGDHIVDPFGGVGLGALDAMRHGLHWHGCELEPKFYRLGQGMDCPGFDKAYWKQYQQRGRKWYELNICPDCAALLDANNKKLPLHHWFGRASRSIPCTPAHRYSGNIERWTGKHGIKGTAVLHQGDSRQLSQVIGAAGGCVSSPPFLETNTNGRQFGASQVVSRNPEHNWVKSWENGERQEDRSTYGSTPGQLGSMPAGDFAAALDGCISSPPYGDAVSGQGEGTGARTINDWSKQWGANGKNSSQPEYGRTPGNLGNLRMDAAVSSPPFQDPRAVNGRDIERTRRDFKIGVSNIGQNEYGDTEGQLGQEQGASFWTAARDIVAQVYEVLKPGGYAAWVCGDFVRNKKRVNFGQQWLELCTAVGFEPVEWIVCWKTEHHGTQLDIFGNGHAKQVDRVSFFRRLANEKNPDNAILNEDVIIVRKPLT